MENPWESPIKQREHYRNIWTIPHKIGEKSSEHMEILREHMGNIWETSGKIPNDAVEQSQGHIEQTWEISYKVVPPKLCLLVYNPINCRYITNKNHSEIGVICTNLAIVWGHHLVGHGGIFMGESSNLSGDLLSWCCGLFFKTGTDYNGTVR